MNKITQTIKKIKILVVEDESIVAMDLVRTLMSFGYDVVGIADTGLGAIQKTEETRPDLILMDIRLKGNMDGTVAATEIWKRFNINIIFLTAYSDEGTCERAKLSEPMAFLLKPINKNELKIAIEIALNKYDNIITQHRESAQRLQNSEDAFKLFVTSTEDYALYLLDTMGNIISWNIGAERMMGYEKNEVISKNFDIFYSAEERGAKKTEHMLKITASTGRFSEQNWQIRKDKTKFWSNIILIALLDDQGLIRGYGKITRDLTVAKTMEDDLHKAIEELRQALIVRDEFISMASHEFRTPLTIISLNLQSAQRRHKLNSKVETGIDYLGRSLGSSLQALDYLNKLIQDLLDVSRIQEGQLHFNFENIDLSKLVVDVSKDFEEPFKVAKIKLECDLQDKVEGIWDGFRFNQVMTNLLSNILKYAPKNPVKITLKADATTAFLTVQDFGIGIPKEMLTEIFKRFGRSSHSFNSGLGLGMYISRTIIEAHGGEIDVESELGRGATFKVTLPRERQ